MRPSLLIAALVLCCALPASAGKIATSASIPKLQKLAAKVRGLKKGVVVVPKAGKAAAKPLSNKATRATALRSLYRQMASLDYRAARVTASLPKTSQTKIAAGLRRLLISGERAGLDEADLQDPDADAELTQACNACPSGTTVIGDDTYGLCYCADPADAAASTASADVSTATLADVAVSTADAAPDSQMDAAIAKLSRFEKIASRNLASGKPKALPKAKIAADAEWHYQRAQVFERMAAAATKPAFPAVKLAKNGRPDLARVATSAKLRRLAARLASGQGPVTVSRPLARGGFMNVQVPRSVMLRNTYATMAALDFRAARLAGLPKAQSTAARVSMGRLANVVAGGRVSRKASRKSAKKAGAKKAGARIADDEGGGDDGGGMESVGGTEPVVFVETSGDSGSSAYSDSGSSSYSDSSSDSGSSSYADSSADSGASSYSDSSSDSSSYSDWSSGDAATTTDDPGSAYADSANSAADASAAGANESSTDWGLPPDPGPSADATSDATAFGGADDNSGFGDTGLGQSAENAPNDPSLADSAPATPSWVEIDQRENAVADPSLAGTPMTDSGAQDPGSDTPSFVEIDQRENALADPNAGEATPIPDDQKVLDTDPIQGPELSGTPDATGGTDALENPDMLQAAGADPGVPPADPLDPAATQDCQSSHPSRKAGARKAGAFTNACMAAAVAATNALYGTDVQVPPPDTTDPALLAYENSVQPNPALVDMSQQSAQAATALMPDLSNVDLGSPGEFVDGVKETISPTTIDNTPVVTMTEAEAYGWDCSSAGGSYGPTGTCYKTNQNGDPVSIRVLKGDIRDRPLVPWKSRAVRGRVSRQAVACAAKSSKVYSVKSGLTFCSAPRAAKVAATAKHAAKPLYSRLSRLDRAARNVSRAVASRDTPRARKAQLLFQRAQAYQRMALALAPRPARRAASKTASKPAANKAEVAKAASKPKAAPKPAKPVVADDVAPAPEPEPAPAPAAEAPAPAAPSEEEVLKKDMRDMGDMEKEMQQQIQQRKPQ